MGMLTIAMLLIVGMLFAAPAAQAATITVCASGCDHTTIQAAINAASSGDTISVSAGTYPESVTVNKSVTIVGASPTTTIIDPPSGNGMNIRASNITIENLRITDAAHGANLGGTISDITFDNVHFLNNTSRGIEIQATAADLITNVQVLDSLFDNNNLGIRMASATRVDGITIDSTTFQNHVGSGFQQSNDNGVGWVKNLTVKDSTFTNNGTTSGYAGIYAEEFSNVLIEDSTFTGNWFGINLWDYWGTAASATSNVVIRDNTFSDHKMTTIALRSTTGNSNAQLFLVENNTINQNVGALVGATSAHLAVTTSSASANGAVDVVDNEMTFSGTFPIGVTATYGVYLAGRAEDVRVEGNTIDGGGVGTNGATIPSSGIRLATSIFQTNANIVITKNLINNFVNGVSIHDGSNVFGGVQAASVVKINRNNLSANSGYGIQSGPVTDANGACNWWGDASGPGPIGPGSGSKVSANVKYAVWLFTNNLDGGNVTNVDTTEVFCSIQEAIDDPDTLSGHTISVGPGIYEEDVNVNKSLTLQGAGPASTTIRGVIGGDGATVRVGASNVTIAGFTITRQGNNTTDWNNAGLNFTGIAVQGASTGMTVRDNILTGNRTAIDINNSSGHTIRNNEITFNRTGLLMRNQTDNLVVVENKITDNWTMGVLFLDASSGTNSPVQTALNSTFSNNDISGNWYGQIVDRQSGGSLPTPGTTNLKDFSGNWLGTITPVVTTVDSAEPVYAAQIPVAYGGTATAPGGQPDILGPASANFDFTPFLTFGTDTDVETTGGRGTFGFQGDFSNLWVTAAGVQIGSTGRIQEGVNLVSGSTVNVADGTYEEAVVIDNKAVTVKGASLNAIVKAPVSVPTCTTTTYDWHPVICAKNSATATIDTLTVDGAGRGNANNRFMGVAFRNSGGAVKNSVIKQIEDTPFSGAQHGVGIMLYNDDAASRTLDVLDNAISAFQKNGMAINSGGTTSLVVTIDGNSVQGKGTTTVTAQNGIQVYQAGGSLTGAITDNAISGIGYDNTSSSTKWVATSILDFYADVDITGNTVTGAQVGVYFIDASGDIQDNDITVNQIGNGGMWGILATDPPNAVPAPYDGDIAPNAAAPEAVAATLTVDVSGNTVAFSGGDNTATYGIEADAGYGPDDIAFTANGNTVTGFEVGIELWQCQSGCTAAGFTSVVANDNCLYNNDYGMRSNVNYLTVDGRENWWGNASGPYNATSNPGGTGNAVVGDIDYYPWVVDGCGGSALSTATLSATTSDALICTGETTIVTIDLAYAFQLFGYQFEMSYDQSKVSVVGAFDNSFFDTAGSFIPPTWNAVCASGVCRFASSKVHPQTAVTGSGDLAKITLSGMAPGTFSMAFSQDLLSDIDGIVIPHDLGAPLPITVCGYTTISGFITMQGRPGNNVNIGTVELTELTPINFSPLSPATFSASNGAYSFSNVPYMPGGSNYKITAKHGLYLDNTKDILVNAPLINQNTRLWGGDANNDGDVTVADLACIGGDFGGAPGNCGGSGSTDINADGNVNIQDLSIAGGNFDKCGPQPWAWNVNPPNMCP